MTDIKSLIIQRAQIKSRLTRFKNKFIEIQKKSEISNSDLTELKDRLTNVTPSLQEFELVHSQISNLATEQDGEDEIGTFENAYYEVVAAVKDFLSKNHSKCKQEIETNKQNVQQTVLNQSSFTLPSVSLPNFDGQFEGWVEFRDSFQSLIHNNSNLADIQKFYYLISCLKGEAAQAIKSLKLSSENYSIAWGILEKRFENKKLIVQNNVKSFFNLEVMKKESHLTLQRFLDDILKIMQCLENFEQPTIDTLLIYIASAKLSHATRYEWELHKSKDEFPTFEEFKDFLEKRCHFLGSIEVNKHQSDLFHSNSTNKTNVKACISTTKSTCLVCKEQHAIYECQTFRKLSVNERIKTIKRLRLCLNCLRGNHFINDCTSQRCKVCDKKHNTLLHVQTNQTSSQNNSSSSTNLRNNSNDVQKKQLESSNESRVSSNSSVNDNSPSSSAAQSNDVSFVNHSAEKIMSQTILSTAVIQVFDIYGKPHSCRALLDPGSQSNFITNKLCNKLGVKKVRFNLTVCGISNNASNVNFKTEINIKSRVNEFSSKISCFVLDQITDILPNKPFNLSKFNIPENIQLADPKCNEPGPIDILLGAGIFWELLCVGVLILYSGLLPGSKEFIDLLEENDKKVVFVSNNSLLRLSEYQLKLKKLGINVRHNELITPITVALEYLKEKKFNKKLYCISYNGLKEDLKEAGYQLIDARQSVVDESSFDSFLKSIEDIDTNVGAVYVDVDFMFSGSSIQKAIRYLRETNVVLFGSGSDKVVPANDTITLMGPGYIHDILKELTGKEPILFGKPGIEMKKYLHRRIKDPTRTIVIGDSLDQDVLLGKICGFQTLLVLSGVSKKSDFEKPERKHGSPDYFVKSVDVFRRLIEKHLRYFKK